MKDDAHLHDESTVLVAVLVQGVQLGDGVIEGLLGELARLVRAVEDLVVEHREVEGEAQPDRVGRLHLGLADLERVLVRLLGVVYNSCRKINSHHQEPRGCTVSPFLSSPVATSDRYRK